MTVSSEHVAKIAEWRQKAREGTLTQDEMRAAIVFLRGERTAAAATPRAGKSKAASVDQASLLSELDAL